MKKEDAITPVEFHVLFRKEYITQRSKLVTHHSGTMIRSDKVESTIYVNRKYPTCSLHSKNLQPSFPNIDHLVSRFIINRSLCFQNNRNGVTGVGKNDNKNKGELGNNRKPDLPVLVALGWGAWRLIFAECRETRTDRKQC